MDECGGGDSVRRMEFLLCNLPEIKQKLFTRAFSEGMERPVRKPISVATGDGLGGTERPCSLSPQPLVFEAGAWQVCASVQMVRPCENAFHPEAWPSAFVSVRPAPQCTWGSTGGIFIAPHLPQPVHFLAHIWLEKWAARGAACTCVATVVGPGGLGYLCGWKVPGVVVRRVTAV